MNSSANRRNSSTVSSHYAFTRPTVSAYLYNPPVEEIRLEYPYEAETEIERLEPALTLQGAGFADGRGCLVFRIMNGDEVLHQGDSR